MKVGELRKQGFKAIAGDELTNGLPYSIKLSIGGAVAVNEGHHDELEIVDLLRRDKTSEEHGFKGYTEYSLDGWKPYLGKVYVEYKSVNLNDEKPVFTQAMADAGELPPVGSEFMMKHNDANETWAQPDFHSAKMKAIGDELFIIESGAKCNGNKESVGAIKDYTFKPLDTRTEKQKAVDIANKEFLVDKPTLEAIYDLWAHKIEQ